MSGSSDQGVSGDGSGVAASGRIVFVPGLGADGRLFGPQLEHYGERAAAIELERPERGDDLGSYARRLGAAAGERWGLEPGGFAVAGFSFGSQVAMEWAFGSLAGAADGPPRPGAVVLVSGLRTREAVTRSFRARVRLGRLVPTPIVEGMLRRMAGKFAVANRLNDEQVGVLRSMAADANARMLKMLGVLAAEWRFGEEEAEAVRSAGIELRQLHGEEDDVIPLIGRHAHRVVPGAPHLITWTHPAEVIRAVDGVGGWSDGAG